MKYLSFAPHKYNFHSGTIHDQENFTITKHVLHQTERIEEISINNMQITTCLG